MVRLFFNIFATLLLTPLPGAFAEVTEAELASIASNSRGNLDFDTLSKNFGTVKRGMKLFHRFSFKNIGKGPVVIQGVHSSCGCAVTELEKGKKYQPGEVGYLTVTLDTAHYRGKLSKSVTVLTTEAKYSSRTLKLKANVEEEVTADPPVVDFGEVSSGELLEKKVVIKPVKLGKPLTIEDVSFNNENLDVAYAKEGDHFVLTIKLRPQAAAGYLKDTILVENNSKYLSKLPVLVRGFILNQIAFSPAYLDFGTVSDKRNTVKTLQLEGEQHFAIKGVRSEININGKMIDDAADFIEVQPSGKEAQKQDIKIRLQNRGEKGSVFGRVIFETSNPQQKELAVEFYAFFKG